MENSNIRVLRGADRSALENLIKPDQEKCMFLRYNLHRGGLNYTGKPGQSIFMGVIHDQRVASVISLTWNGHIQIFAPEEAGQLCSEFLKLLRKTGRLIAGINGAAEYVRPALDSLGLTGISRQLDTDERLFMLRLPSLQMPVEACSPEIRLRKVLPEDFDTLVEWQVGYSVEALNANRDEKLYAGAERRIRSLISGAGEDTRILEAGGQAVSRTNFTAVLPDAVTVGGVWTPPSFRNRGFARTAVALHLQEVEKNGVETAVLFTNSPAAERAYKAIGFSPVGQYSMILFSGPVKL